MRSLPTTFMQKKRHNIWILLMSLALFLLAAVLSLLLGSAAFSPAELWKAAGGADAAVLRTRISELRAAARAAQDREEAERLKRRIAELQVLRRQSSELAELTKRYYERNYHRDERYTL